ncbi:hypothetical protein DL765_007248 [Monosporascus sp. GIB2]|nr:hypothetical protein DL765_007248 [Monosporascus sp. GIB2]
MLFKGSGITLLTAAAAVTAQWDASRYAWYTSAGGTDFAATLPIGNGRLGAAVYGGATEQVTLNENSMWSGPYLDRANRNSARSLGTIRQQLINGQITAAGQSTLNNMAGNPTSPRAYNPLVDLALDFGHSQNAMSAYQRVLDTSTGSAWVTYTLGGVNYTREYISSYPHGVLAFRMRAGTAGKLNVKVSLQRSQNVQANTATIASGIGTVSLRASSGQSSGAITFTSAARVVQSGGSLSASGNSVSVTGATTVDIFFNAETSYRYSSQSAWERELTRKLDAAVTAGYAAVKSAGVADFSALSGRVNLNLGSSGSAGNRPTDQRLSAYKSNPGADPQLAVLMFNYGRHLLLSCSRDTGALSLPANLQGIWNKDYSPAWQSKYTININTEMNYWPALSTNLAETHKPLFDLIDVARPRGQAVAQIMYNCNNGGFVLHHNTDLWGDAAPVDKGTPYMMWPMGAAWLSHHAMEHYRYTLDRNFLSQRAWPILRDTAKFYYCYLFDYQNYWTTGPSLSPENPFRVPSNMQNPGATEGIDISPSMDNQLLYQLFTDVIEAAQVLNVTGSDVDNAKAYLPKIKPPQIGSKGQILEWRNEYAEAEPAHRHMSPLWGLFPGVQMTPLQDARLAAAGKVLLDNRMRAGSGSTGWSRTWVINLYARLFLGDTVWSNVVAFLQKYPSTNMWNTDGGAGTTFQIDGNFGYTSGIAEMLLQSHNGQVHMLPALPSALGSGSVSGLVARGNFAVDMSWANKALTKATITSRSGGRLAIRVQNGSSFSVNGTKYSGAISTMEGGVYSVTVP